MVGDVASATRTEATQPELQKLHARRSTAGESHPNESAARTTTSGASLLSNDECSEGTIYSCARRTFVKDKRCLFLCVACMHCKGQQCPTMPRHVELLVCCFSPFQTRRLGECHPLDTPARVGFTKTPLSDAYASEPGACQVLLLESWCCCEQILVRSAPRRPSAKFVSSRTFLRIKNLSSSPPPPPMVLIRTAQCDTGLSP